jgi:segregation and condensation protein A
VEYERIKLAAARLDELPRAGRDFVRSAVTIEQTGERRFPDVNVVELRDAWADVIKRAKLYAHHKIGREELSVREHMSLILKRLQGARFVEFAELFDPSKGVPLVVVHFLALLELARESLIEITQASPFAPIYVRLAYVPS